MTQRLGYGEVPKPLFSAMMKLEQYVNNGAFSVRFLELMRFRVAQINGCVYCLDMHYKEAVAAGEQPLRLYSLSAWRETDYYDEKERAMLAWCEAVTAIDRATQLDALFAELQQHYQPAEIAHLTLAICQINSWTRLAKAFGFPGGLYQVGTH